MSLDDWDGSGASVFVDGPREQIVCTVGEPQRFDFAVIPGEFPDLELSLDGSQCRCGAPALEHGLCGPCTAAVAAKHGDEPRSPVETVWRKPGSPADHRAIVNFHMANMKPEKLARLAAFARELEPDCPGCPDR